MSGPDDLTLYDRVIRWCKDQWIIVAGLLVFGGLVGLGALTGALNSIVSFGGQLQSSGDTTTSAPLFSTDDLLPTGYSLVLPGARLSLATATYPSGEFGHIHGEPYFEVPVPSGPFERVLYYYTQSDSETDPSILYVTFFLPNGESGQPVAQEALRHYGSDQVRSSVDGTLVWEDVGDLRIEFKPRGVLEYSLSAAPSDSAMVATTPVDPETDLEVQAPPANESPRSRGQTITNSPGSIQAGRDVVITGGAPDTSSGTNEETVRLQSEIRRVLHFPDTVEVSRSPAILIRLLRDQAPRKLFEVLKRYDDIYIGQVPEAGPTLQEFFEAYYSFEQEAAELENQLLTQIGSTVVVRFRQGWNIYLRYVLLRLGGMTQDQVISEGNFLNYDITWDDAERVFAELSGDPSVSQRFADAIAQHQGFIDDVNKLKALPPLAG